jgi:hypothetical protein
MSFDGNNHHPPFIDLDVHILVQLTIGCVHAIMANGNADIDITNKHLDFCHLLKHHQVLALQLGECNLHHFKQWGNRNAHDPPH